MMTNHQKVPNHVAIIMDGNGRWAQGLGQARTEGHRRGADSVRTTVRACRKRDVKFLTLYAFSVANWKRPATEVKVLMHLLAHFAKSECEELRSQGIRLEVIGNIQELPLAARLALESTISETAHCQDMVLSLALSYGGRSDLAGAARALAIKVKNGLLQPEDINEESLQQEMTTHRLPAVDLLIRTGGESRVSDFLLYEAAYAELLFLPIMWPEFDEENMAAAIAHYAKQERRFGLTSRQVQPAPASTQNPAGTQNEYTTVFMESSFSA